MKKTIAYLFISFVSFSFVFCSGTTFFKNKIENPNFSEPQIITIVGKAKWKNETTLRCKGKKNTCAIIGDEGGMHTFKVFENGGEEPSDEFLITEYQLTEGVENDESFTDIVFERYQE